MCTLCRARRARRFDSRRARKMRSRFAVVGRVGRRDKRGGVMRTSVKVSTATSCLPASAEAFAALYRRSAATSVPSVSDEASVTRVWRGERRQSRPRKSNNSIRAMGTNRVRLRPETARAGFARRRGSRRSSVGGIVHRTYPSLPRVCRPASRGRPPRAARARTPQTTRAAFLCVAARRRSRSISPRRGPRAREHQAPRPWA